MHITVLDIEDIISTLDLNKAVGLDLISHKLLYVATFCEYI